MLFASAAIGAALLPLGAAEAQVVTPFDWSGFYIGVHGGFLQGNVSVNDESTAIGDLSGPIAGVVGGYNFPVSPFAPGVVGIEADVGFGNFNGTGGDSCPSTGTLVIDCAANVFTYDFDWNAHLRVRAGVPIGNALLFIAGGLAWAHLNVTEEYAAGAGGLYTGGTIGGGLDLKLAPNVVARVEGLFDSFGRKTYGDYSVDFSSWTARAALMVRLP